ncbi:MAG TPA: glycine zipper 2TM domain-containing protein [Pusillimonas sp.]|jgi:outer membrane lipoprotein SlyB|uniref:glycine zipper 2TM domain-containing protein n=1 Tax=unclassified Pusillimonas TaxID=2640016 RepID=UPI0026268B22|nr:MULTISPECIES: glycine zipper 2TM domain-containing protein [unclassified Pusillimonas]HLU19739.1 glycine zipper 2TM domain-containing protein [Pusillimonas sp.]
MKIATLILALAGMTVLTACQTPSNGQARNSEFNCIAGTVGGAIVGGLLGSTIGGGTGRTAATAVGIGAGGYLGNRMGCK